MNTLDTKDCIDLVMALATVGLAVFTAWMACETKKLAKEGRDSAILMDIHHQEKLAPILHFHPDTNGFVPDGIKFDWWNNPTGCRCQIGGTLHNSGLGPAINIKLTVIIPNYSLLITFIAPPMGVLEKQECNQETIHTNFSETDCHFLESNKVIWEMLIEYTDLFGNAYSTKLVNNPRDNKKVIYNSPETFFKNRYTQN